MAARFKEVSGEDRRQWEALHIATLTQEAALMLALASVRFKAPAVVKANKFGELTVSLRALRHKASAVLKETASGLGKVGTQASTSERPMHSSTCAGTYMSSQRSSATHPRTSRSGSETLAGASGAVLCGTMTAC
ncbi:hypothetical protein DFH11DRAFT_316816 [Phellopilus nigrolimitatus]|nr:hypothetical protein DFH11DRAFT_316816 [Phellopilus nigrolimitatus]